MNQQTLDSKRSGDRVEGVFLVENASLKTARNGKLFITMTLRDHTLGLKAVRWESNRDEFRELDRNPFLRVQARVEEYQGNLQLILDNLDPLSASEVGLQAAEFLPRTSCDIEVLERELEERVTAIKNNDVRQVVVKILERPGLRDQLRISPAGKTMHHAYIGGLLEHVVSLVTLADRICDHYSWLDRDILIGGVILHDIAKTAELGVENGISYTNEGQLLGHIVLCCNWIHEASTELEDVDHETVLQIQHIVASHHGFLEFGSPKKPMTAEALAMHYIDNLDAKLMAFLGLYEKASPGPQDPRFGEHSYILDVRPYFPEHLDTQGSNAIERPEIKRNKAESSDSSQGTGSLPF
ncbi:MAG: hypothetical protein CMJ95_02560 [Planctomycetes bacterium]|nr:hypothetical protein [Planctomycetota bacterium]